jgi:hypothetical protein
MYDQYGNHINASSTSQVYFDVLSGDGDLGAESVDEETGNIRCVYSAYEYDADTSHVQAWLQEFTGRSRPGDTVTVFSAEPGDFDHYSLDVIIDSSHVSDGNMYQSNIIRIEAQDGNNIRLYTYDNDDTVTIVLNESAAADSQVVWFLDPPIYVMSVADDMAFPDTIGVGLNAFIPIEALRTDK